MNREPVAGKQVGARENVGSARHATDPDAAPSKLSQPGKCRGMFEKRGIASGTDENVVEIRVRPDAKLGLNSHPVGSCSRLSID